MKCPICASENRKGSGYCGKCGYKYNENDYDIVFFDRSRLFNKALAVVLLFCLAFILYMNREHSSEMVLYMVMIPVYFIGSFIWTKITWVRFPQLLISTGLFFTILFRNLIGGYCLFGLSVALNDNSFLKDIIYVSAYIALSYHFVLYFDWMNAIKGTMKLPK